MAELIGEKTHDPTPRRRQQARDEGQVARSPEVASALLLCGAVGVVLWLGRPVVDFLGQLTVRQLGGDPWLAADVLFVTQTWSGLASALAAAMLPILGAMILLAVAGNIMQVGFLFVPSKALPDLSRIDPLKGAGRLFSLAIPAKLAFGLLKLAVVLCVAWYSLEAERDRILNCGQLSLADLAAFVAEILIWTALKVGLALLALSAVDYGYERIRHERDLRMTVQEMHSELRDAHGDPQVTAQARLLRAEIGQRSLASAAAQANLVIVDPQGLAIAIRYDPDSAAAPIVLAKGAGPQAQRIRAMAASRRVAMCEQADIARSLYQEVDVQRPIPPRFYAGLAELLAAAE